MRLARMHYGNTVLVSTVATVDTKHTVSQDKSHLPVDTRDCIYKRNETATRTKVHPLRGVFVEWCKLCARRCIRQVTLTQP